MSTQTTSEVQSGNSLAGGLIEFILSCFLFLFQIHRKELSILLLLFLLLAKLFFCEDPTDFWNIVCEIISIQITNDANYK